MESRLEQDLESLELGPPPYSPSPYLDGNLSDQKLDSPPPFPSPSHSDVKPLPVSQVDSVLASPTTEEKTTQTWSAPSTSPPPLPTRPPLAGHLFSEPYIAPAHLPSEQGPSMTTPQYARPFTGSQREDHDDDNDDDNDDDYDDDAFAQMSALERPRSTPPILSHNCLPTVGTHPVEVAPPPTDVSDERESGWVKRTIGNNLYVRSARAVGQTVMSSFQMPFYLSPWGDNNPVTLPNVRLHEIAMAAVTHGTADFLAPSFLDTAADEISRFQFAGEDKILKAGKYATKALLKRKPKFLDHTEKIKPAIHESGGVTSIKITVKHKLMGEKAVIALTGETETPDHMNCAKGWFCPYLYASGRTPLLERSKSFAIASLRSPCLAADATLAPILLSALHHPSPDTAASPIQHLCPFESPSPTMPHLSRLAILFTGIAPFRTATAWSQARLPNEGRFLFHLFSTVPAIVVPVTAAAPVCAWSPWTMRQVMGALDGYQAERHAEEMFGFVEQVVREDMVAAELRKEWKSVLKRALVAMVEAIQQLMPLVGQFEKIIHAERAGVVMLRY